MRKNGCGCIFIFLGTFLEKPRDVFLKMSRGFVWHQAIPYYLIADRLSA